MKVEIIPCLADNYCYIVNDEKTNTVAAVDPSENKPVDGFLKK